MKTMRTLTPHELTSAMAWGLFFLWAVYAVIDWFAGEYIAARLDIAIALLSMIALRPWRVTMQAYHRITIQHVDEQYLLERIESTYRQEGQS